MQEGLIDPGPGVATFFPAAAIDPSGNIGISYMESSSTEFVSAYVAGHIAGTPLGTTTPGTVFGPGGGLDARELPRGRLRQRGLRSWHRPVLGRQRVHRLGWQHRYLAYQDRLVLGLRVDRHRLSTRSTPTPATTCTSPPRTPAGGPNEFVNNFYPELLLYDPNGNLVAIAAGNASDGRNSVIDFTVPDGDAGKWTIEVTPSPNTPMPTQGEYGLLVTGATGALSPFVVTSTIPADGALVQPPTDYIVTFSQPVLGVLTDPGRADDQRRSRHGGHAGRRSHGGLDDRSCLHRHRQPRAQHGGHLGRSGDRPASQGRQRCAARRFTSTFTTDNVAPYVVSSSVDGQVFSPAPANVTEVVTFSEPMNTAFTTAASFDLLGNYRNVHYAAASFSWDPTGTILTINYVNLPDDTYTLTLFASGFQDLVGHPLASDYVGQLRRRAGHRGVPDPAHARAAAGRPDLHGLRHSRAVHINRC